MTDVCLVSQRNGEIVSCKAEGHSGYAPAGSDIICAAVTVLLRTTLQVISESCSAVVSAEFSERGKLSFCVRNDGSSDSRLIYAADFLRKGFETLSFEYPKHVSFREEIRD